MTCTELLIYESVTKYFLRYLYTISSDVVKLRHYFGCIRFEATALRHCAQPHS